MAAIRLMHTSLATGPGLWLLLLVSSMISQPASAGPTFTLGGRLDVDVAHYYADQTPLDSGAKLRRLRLEIGGKLSPRISYYALADFKDGTYRAQASWLRFSIDRENQIYAGRIETPFSIQRVTNSQYNLFMERSLTAALTPHYGTGMVYQHKGDQWSFRAGLFGEDRLNFGGAKNFGNTAAIRLGKRLRAGDSRFWLAVGGMYQQARDIERVRVRPESSVTDQRLVDTRKLTGLDSLARVGLEGVWKRGAWSLQGEWTRYEARQADGSRLRFGSGYIEASRIFNGRRRFNFRSGEWMSSEVVNFKTWELAFRASRIDLQDKWVSGGRETNYSIGTNYYFNPVNRLMLNFIKVDASPNRHGINESPYILQARLQIGF